jgi:hypothetical protein
VGGDCGAREWGERRLGVRSRGGSMRFQGGEKGASEGWSRPAWKNLGGFEQRWDGWNAEESSERMES